MSKFYLIVYFFRYKFSAAVSLLLFFVLLLNCSKILDPDESGNLVPKTVSEDSNLPSRNINGVRLHLETMGNIANPIIIFLHGGPGCDYRAMISSIGVENASRYPSQRKVTNGGLSVLQDKYYCVFFDQRGAGLSPRFDPGEVSFEKYITDVDAIIDTFLLAKKLAGVAADSQVTLFGWSFGGVLATGYANAHPTKVRDIVVYEPGPFTFEARDTLHFTSVFSMIGKPSLDEWLGGLKHITADSHARADYQLALGAGRFAPEFHENPNTPVWRFGKLVKDDIDDFGAVIENHRLVNNLSSFNGRFLFIYGELEKLSLPGYSTIEMSYYTHATSVAVPGVGHDGAWERADTISAIIRVFLK